MTKLYYTLTGKAKSEKTEITSVRKDMAKSKTSHLVVVLQGKAATMENNMRVVQVGTHGSSFSLVITKLFVYLREIQHTSTRLQHKFHSNIIN